MWGQRGGQIIFNDGKLERLQITDNHVQNNFETEVENRKMKLRQVSTLRMGIFTPKRDYRVGYGEMTSVVATSRAQQFCLLLGKLLVVVKALSCHLGSRVTN